MSARRAIAAALLVPLALLSACTADEPVPKMPDPTTSEPTSEPTQTETPEAETAEEFLRRWQAESDAMQVSGDTKAFLRMTYKCKACGDFVDAVDDIYSGGGSVDAQASTITKISRYADDPPTFDMFMKATKTVIRKGDGSVERLPGGTQGLRIILERRAGEWYVRYYGVL